jgi:hypothetical protein
MIRWLEEPDKPGRNGFEFSPDLILGVNEYVLINTNYNFRFA